MKIDTLSFKSQNLTLRGSIYIPELQKEKYPALCLCHGIPAVVYNPDDRGWAVLAEHFCAEGFITMIFNFRGAGLSEGNFDMLGWCHDLNSALDIIYNYNQVDINKVFLLGSSGGATTSVYVTAHDKRIAGLVTLACPSQFNFIRNNDINAVISHFRRVGIIRDKDFPQSIDDWLKNFDIVSSINWIDKISPRPLLLIHGDKDELVPVQQAGKLYNKAKEPKELVIIPDAGHRLRLEERAIELATRWLKEKAKLL